MTEAELNEIGRMLKSLSEAMVCAADKAKVMQIAEAYWTGGFSEDGSYPHRRKNAGDQPDQAAD